MCVCDVHVHVHAPSLEPTCNYGPWPVKSWLDLKGNCLGKYAGEGVGVVFLSSVSEHHPCSRGKFFLRPYYIYRGCFSVCKEPPRKFKGLRRSTLRGASVNLKTSRGFAHAPLTRGSALARSLPPQVNHAGAGGQGGAGCRRLYVGFA